MNPGLQSELERHQREIERASRAIQVLSPFVTLETKASYAYVGLAWEFEEDKRPTVTLYPEHADEANALIHEVLRIVGQKKAAKSFDPANGKVKYTIESPSVRVFIESVPPRCEVEEYEEEVVVPAEAERVETRKKFRLKNPEECLGKGAV